jgi:hypothetical protein
VGHPKGTGFTAIFLKKWGKKELVVFTNSAGVY